MGAVMDGHHSTPPQVPRLGGAAEQAVRGHMSFAAMHEELLNAAVSIVRGGWPVFPAEIYGKRPVVPRGFKAATTDLLCVRNWWEGRYAGSNIGVPTGYPGPDVLDVDQRPDGSGWAALSQLRDAGLLAGAFRIVRTPSGGWHVYFAGTGQRSGSLKAEHLDLKAAGGYVVVPPSQVGGRPYVIVDDRPQTGATFDWEAAKRKLAPPRPYRPRPAHGYRSGPGSAAHLVSWLEGEYQGNRNSGLFWAACAAIEAGDEAVINDLADVALSAGLGEAEVRRTVESAYKKVTGDGR